MHTKSILPLFVLSLLLCFSSCSRKANIYIYKSQGENFNFPEKDLNLKSTGVCFSGGGTRAMTCAAGQMKALDSLGLWPHVGYISSVSGGSWASSVFTYYEPTPNGPQNDLELLGVPEGASNLTLDGLRVPISPKHMIYAVTRDLSGRILERILEDDFTLGILEHPSDIWIDAIGSTYLKPYGLYGGHKRYFTLDEASRDDIIKRSPKLKLQPSDFHLVHNQKGDAPRPYLVMNSAVLGPRQYMPLPEPEQMTVFNYSPLGVGTVQYQNVDYGNFSFPVGGGFIEPFGMGGSHPISAPEPCGDGRDCATIRLRRSHKFRLADAAGTSSAAFAAMMAEDIPLEILSEIVTLGSMIPEERYWSVAKEKQASELYRFADGGSLENFGVISLLQRKVDKMVVFINTSSPIDTNFDPKKDQPTAKTMTYDFYTLFGDYTYENHFQNQVFSQAEFENVFKQFKECIKNGKTVMAKSKTKTIANPWWGIQEGQEVEILWVYNYKVPEWEKLLKQQVQDEIAKGDEGMFPGFPWYATEFPANFPFVVRLTQAMTKMLYELQFWNVYHNQEAFEFLHEP